ncbi:MAG: hypothetical protein OJF49_004795 [Ktedonobacterales bacterium]|jgi:tetratricopeptide (TPR) repeat protein|nr:MAG: hypothetical protein OJF49_004795 [Ktedonobacterales bacterium]
MSREIVLEALVVARHEQPPMDATVLRALAAAGLGSGSYAAAEIQQAEMVLAPGMRKRLGMYTLTMGAGGESLRAIVYRYGGAITEGIGEPAFLVLTRGLAASDTQTLRESTLAFDLRVTVPQERTLAATEWMVKVEGALLELVEGVCIDPAAERCYGREQMARLTDADPLVHVSFHAEAWNADSRWLHTHGLRKFGCAEIDMVAVPNTLEAEGEAFLRDVAASLASGAQLAAGGEVDMGEFGLAEAVAAPVDAEHQAPYGRLRLVDSALPGERQGISPVRMLKRMALADAERQVREGQITAALETLERVLAAEPDDCAALALKAAQFLSTGHVTEALNLGELMELRVPGDYRGPLTVGRALAALGRYREALAALNRAISLDPEAAEAFAGRADVHERLGQALPAREDRAHAVYLGYRG